MANRKLLILLLKRIKGKTMDCTEYENGLLALQAVEKNINYYKIIFMDNIMPEMNGLDSVRKIRDLGYNHFIVGVTGDAMDQDLIEFTNAGVDILITKPVKMEQIKQIFAFIDEHGTSSTRHKLQLNFNGNKLIQTPISQV
jgi:CheY-like chemotaxis protein